MRTLIAALSLMGGCSLPIVPDAPAPAPAPAPTTTAPVVIAPTDDVPDVEPPQRLDIVLDIMQYPDMAAVEAECARMGGTPAPWDGSDSRVCSDVDY